ncbi:ADP-ribosylglycohydrolase family protein [Bacteroides uniformis]|uniref:ADP-ribosylglycohydrolase family protein n=1 Tax=Bacteroides uniformis TaxID=820 RepID=UPI0018985BA0
MKNNYLQIIVVTLLSSMAVVGCSAPQSQQNSFPKEVTLSKSVLLDKIKGAWAGQTIGCTYGGPTEFKFRGTMIQDYNPIRWDEGCIKNYCLNGPGLYDDIYMDLTFVEVFDRLGLDAPVDSFAMAFANAGYVLWHANQAARYNILQGIMPPASGHWLNNPHANDLDYQIEADYSGIMSPGMPNAASDISDKIGHIMNYGDGWYGGVYVGAMYSLAFVSDDIEFIVTEALKTIPEESLYFQVMKDVIGWYRQYPDDWKQTWFECERKYSEDIGCPDGVFVPYNIDATINSAYILIGLLYGKGDFFRTMDIATRCGQDSDCNPASAAGILGTMLGYSRIPEYWMKNLREAEDIDFAFTSSSLNKAYQMSYNHALQMIERNGGYVDDSTVTIVCQKPEPVRLEKAFEGMYPIMRKNLNRMVEKFDEFEFEGTGFVMRGSVKSKDDDYVAYVSVYLDGELVEEAKLPANFTKRRQELCWRYQLPKGRHILTLKWNNPTTDATVHCGEVIVYSDTPIQLNHQ